MYFMLNAVKNIYRYKSRYILFSILYFSLIVAASITVQTFYLSGEAVEQYRRDFLSTAAMSRNRIGYFDPVAQRAEYLALLNSPYVSEVRFYAFLYQPLQADGIYLFNQEGMARDTGALMQHLGVLGLDTSELHMTGLTLNIQEGRMFEHEGEAVVFATTRWHRYEGGTVVGFDHFAVGDRVVFDGEVPHEFTIVGLLETPDTFDVAWPFNVPSLLITHLYGATTFEALPQAHGSRRFTDDSGRHPHAPLFHAGYNTVVYLSDPGYFESFRDEIMQDDNAFMWVWPRNEHMARTVQDFIYSLRGFSLLFIMLVAFLVVVLTVIATMILVSGRKYDIAVLRSIGMSKGKIILGFVVEKLLWLWGLFIPAFFMGLVVFVFTVMPALVTNAPIPLVVSVWGTALYSFVYIFLGTTAAAGLSLLLAVGYVLSFEPLKIFNKKD